MMGGAQGGVPPGRGTHQLDLAGVPPSLAGPSRGTPLWTDTWMDGQTGVKTLPSRCTTYAVGNKQRDSFGTFCEILEQR